MIAEAVQTFQFDKVDDVIADIAAGRMVIVTDDADRENEGDLVMAARRRPRQRLISCPSLDAV